MNYRAYFWTLNILITLLKFFLIFATKSALSAQEAGHWLYSKFISYSYLEMPPLTAYIIKLSTLIFGDNTFALRFPSVVLFFFSSVILYSAAKRLFGEKTAFLSFIIINLIPLFAIPFYLMTTYDSIIIFLWLISFFIFILIIQTNNKNYWYLLGLSCGLSLLSGFGTILIGASVFLFILFSRRHRGWLLRKEPYFAALIVFIAFLPVLFWNIENSWAGFWFEHRINFANSGLILYPKNFFNYLANQFLYIFPLIFLLLWGTLFFCFYKGYFKKNENICLAAFFSVLPLILFNIISLFGINESWTIGAGYFISTIAASFIIILHWKNKIFKTVVIFSFILAFIFSVFFVARVVKKLSPSDIDFDPLKRTNIVYDIYGWEEIGAEIRKIADAYPVKSRPFIFTNDKNIADRLSFVLPEFKVICISPQIDDYDIWQRNIMSLRNKDGLFVSSHLSYFDPRNYKNVFKNYGETIEIPIFIKDDKIRTFFITPSRFFRPQNLDAIYTSSPIEAPKDVYAELLKYDYNIFRFINTTLHFKALDYPMSWITYFDNKGINISFFIIFIICTAILWTNKKQNFWMTFALFVSALIISTLISYTIKITIHRPRPLAVFGPENVKYFYETVYGFSFPSGHTQAAFAMCVFVFMHVRKFWYLYFILCFGVGFERIYVGSHFPSDVLTGAIIGSVSAYIVVKTAEILEEKRIEKAGK
ncbi:MAG: glycosyltransferase family 39 protein [Elusimicrobiota bacterium]|jgi:4-amino-4-deoxy-L-arabinose transferase-like glycosyltransferase|nr:glycosyltransferase family 39 protein [Elusimicrobiota bacterium]